MTKIISTIGPSSESRETLEFFAQQSVQIARFNASHNNGGWHIETAQKAQEAGLEILLDLPGPKLRLGDFSGARKVETGDKIVLESRKSNKKYPYYTGKNIVIPVSQGIIDILDKDEELLVNDGLLRLVVEKKKESFVVVRAMNAGTISSKKSINLPESELAIDFMTPRDIDFIENVIPRMQPDYVAISFVKNIEDIKNVKKKIQEVIEDKGLAHYTPKIVAKIETQSAVADENLTDIIKNVDMVMIARGDLALETTPNHIKVPFLQDKIVQKCQQNTKPFVVATQILQSMTGSPSPTRAEMSDLYRAVVINQASYVMLSGETASGQYPHETVTVIDSILKYSKKK